MLRVGKCGDYGYNVPVALNARGKIKGQAIVLEEPLPLPEGTEVVARIEPLVPTPQTAVPLTPEQFATLPFFGMWAERNDMADSTAWVRGERKQWQRRATRPD